MTQTNSMDEEPKPKFLLGRLFFTAEVVSDLLPEDVFRAVRRHRCGDWGDLGAEDKEMNEKALVSGDRLLSAYHDRNGVKFWIITEARRSMTTVLLPSEY